MRQLPLSVFLAAALVCLASGPARAAGKGAKSGPADVAAATDDSPIDLPVLTVPQPQDSAAIGKLFRGRHRLGGKGYSVEADHRLAQLREKQLDLGLPNLFAVAVSLTREGDQAMAKGNGKRAIGLYTQAARLAPSLGEPLYRRAWARLRHTPTDAYDAGVDLVTGLSREIGDFPSAVVLGVNSLARVLLALAFAIGGFLLVVFIRCLRLFVHDLRGLLPGGLGSSHAVVLAALLLVGPPILGSPFIVTLLVWIAVAWQYSRISERVILGVGLALLGLLPLGLGYIGKGLELPSSTAAYMYRVAKGEDDGHSPGEVKRCLAKAKGQDAQLLWVLGLYHKRRGDLPQAEVYFRRAIGLRAGAAAHVNLGNVILASKRDWRKAFDQYDKASRTAEANFNMSQIYRRSHQTPYIKQGTEAVMRAKLIDADRVSAFQAIKKPRLNRFVMDLYPPNSLYWKRLLSSKRGDRFATAVWGGVMPWIPLGWGWTLGLGVLALLIGLRPATGKLFGASVCASCGRTVCSRCDPENQGESCSQCLAVFSKGDTTKVAPQVRIEKEIAVRRYERRKSLLVKIVSILFPGSGQILFERPVKGFFIMLVPAAIGAGVLLAAGVVQHPMALGSPLGLWSAVAGGTVFAALYVHSVLEVFRRD